jgi:hypothetical protein
MTGQMTGWEMVAVLLAGVGAGTVNTIVGSGTLITFPVLLAIGYPPVLANVSNSVGLTPGSITGAYGYRAELAGQRRRLVSLGAASMLAALVGGLLLLKLPAEAFRGVVPVLIGIALVLVILQPRLARRLAQPHDPKSRGGGALRAGVFGSGVYGGYFGAAQGVLLIAIMGVFLNESLQRINAAKNVLAAIVNGTASVLFIVMSEVAWGAAALIATGAVLGGFIGASVGRRIPPAVLRGLIVIVGLLAIVKIVMG